MKIVIATTNLGKKRELEQMLDSEVEILSLRDFKNIKEVEENGQSFAENARKKAIGYAKQTNMYTLADDSGLEIDALGGAPGVHSARFSGTHKNHSSSLIDHENIEKVLQLMKEVPKSKRTARFVCSLCLASPEGVIFEVEGQLEGLITSKKYGDNGFGYDPIFYVPSMDKTTAQMSEEEKNSISHRGEAIKKFKEQLLKSNMFSNQTFHK